MPDREKVIKGLEHCAFGSSDPCYENDCPYYQSDCTEELKKDILALLKAQPDVVRCKDCKHSTMTADGKLCKYCDFYKEDDGSPMQLYHEGDWFCADGERKEGR